jgi:EAL and modified HD-GYP domain-containing signal transduction protein
LRQATHFHVLHRQPDKRYGKVCMATQALPGKGSAVAPAEMDCGLRYVARQPIMDRRSRVHGYELLFRAGPEAVFRGDGDLATRTMLDNTVMFGLERLTCGLPAFVNCTLESLTEELVNVLPPSMTVLEILESLEPTPDLIAVCRKLKCDGFRLALDDFIWEPRFEPLVELADYIKVDVTLTGTEERKRLLKTLDGVAAALLAEKVETQDEYKQACDEGFTFFQGYYFCRPVLIENRKVPSNRLSNIEILQLLRSDSVELKKLTRLVKRDASLTYRLLRLVNSPVCAVRHEVSSIQSALLAVGEDTFRRIATLAITSELSGSQPAEILRMAFLRGRFCELAAGSCGLDATEQYMLGLLSLLPAMLRVPMAELTPALPLRVEIRNALEGAAMPERSLLAWLEFHERGDWAACDGVVQAYGLKQDELMKCYAEAMVWAEDALKFA